MAVKNTAQVIIGGKIITLGGYESEEYFQQVASYMNKKIGELETVQGYGSDFLIDIIDQQVRQVSYVCRKK